MSRSGQGKDYLRQGRRDRLIRELDHDPYHSKLKLREPTVCPECKAVFLKGRWTWQEEPANAMQQLCPACQRIKDKVPAAFLTIHGDFLETHSDEVINLIYNYEKREKAQHPLKRIMGSDVQEGRLVFRFTDAHLARGIGEALHNAYEGEIDYQYSKEDIMLRVSWTR